MEVALLDAKGDEVPGFERASSALTVCDPLRHEVVWKQEDGTTRTLRDAPKGTPLAFRFDGCGGHWHRPGARMSYAEVLKEMNVTHHLKITA